MKIKPIDWIETFKEHYCTVMGETPLGTFTIEWKSWETNPGYDISCNFNNEYYESGSDLEHAKELCQSKYEQLVKDCLE